MRLLPIPFFIVLTLLLSMGTQAQEPPPGAYRFEEVRVPLSDGVHLQADLYLPEAEGAHPVALYVPPYNPTSPHRQRRAAYLAEHGYATVVLSPRGKFGSEGVYLPFIDETPDLLDALEWMLDQPWSDGRVGIYGSSSSSYSGQLLAATGHPAIRALVNHSGLTDSRELFFPGGAFRLNTLYPWLSFIYLEERFAPDQWPGRFAQRPLAAGFPWAPGTLYRMAEGMVPVVHIQVPVLHLTGWNDVVYRHTLTLYEGIVQAQDGTVPQALMVGPWMHNYDGEQTQFGDEDYGAASVFSQVDDFRSVVAWFDRYVKGIDNGVDAGVRLFVMGENRWLEAERWPVEGATGQRWYLAPPEDDGSGYAGQLVQDAPMGEGTASYTYDPSNPVLTYGGVNSHLFPAEAGPLDQARFMERPDVLAFASRPLSQAQTLLGRLCVVLHASTDAPDTDFVAKLVVIQPDGYQRIVEDGIVRARYRHGYPRPASALEPGEVYRFELDLGWTALRLNAGDRLGVHISSSNFPKYDLNPNTGMDPLQASDFRSANQTVHFSATYPSYLDVEVLTDASP
ncbi:MAG: CocE/NonD family hydrolase [Rhodothermaceae bacterium]|nr:CocE/NonD family hydrolase [Rhodothermaceae bacterium]